MKASNGPIRVYQVGACYENTALCVSCRTL